METTVKIQEKNVAARTFFNIEGTTTLKDIRNYAHPQTEKLFAEMKRLNLTPIGPIEFVYFGATADVQRPFTLQIGFPVAEKGDCGSEFQFSEDKEFVAVSHEHKGSLEEINDLYTALFETIYAQNLQPGLEVREVYHQYTAFTDPANVTEFLIQLRK